MRSLPLSCLALVLGLAASPAAAEDTEPPRIDHTEVTSATEGKPLRIEATIEDKNGVFDPTLLYRVGGDGAFLRQPMQPEGDGALYVVTLPGEIVSTNLEYFIEAFDELGNGPARFGDDELPVQVKVLKAVPTPPPDDTTAPDDAMPGDDAVDDDDDESEGGPGLGLWLGLGGAGAAVVAVAAAAGVGAFFYFTRPNTPSRVDIVVTDAPTPIGATP